MFCVFYNILRAVEQSQHNKHELILELKNNCIHVVRANMVFILHPNEAIESHDRSGHHSEIVA